MRELNGKFFVFADLSQSDNYVWVLDLAEFFRDPDIREMHPNEVGLMLRAVASHLYGPESFNDFLDRNAHRFGSIEDSTRGKFWVKARRGGGKP